MVLDEYTLYEQTGALVVEWMKPDLPVQIKWIALILLTLMPFLFLFRASFARFADRHLHIHGNPKLFGVVAPLISLLCGFLLIFFRSPQGKTVWNFGKEGILVKNTDGRASLHWSDVDAAAYDAQSPEKAALVLKSKEGRKVVLALSRVSPEHQDKIVGFINTATKNRFNLQPLEEPEVETDDEEIPSPVKSLPKDRSFTKRN